MVLTRSNSRKTVRRNAISALRFRRLTIPKPDVLHQYLQHQSINQYLDYLESRYPSFVKVHEIGATWERRIVKAIEINWRSQRNLKEQIKLGHSRPKTAPTTSTTNDPAFSALNLSTAFRHFRKPQLVPTTRNVVLIEGGTHGREWISIAVALNCIHQLTEKNMRHRDTLNKLRFFVVPIVNPDGYEYSREKNSQWRKNRRPTSSSRKHVGVDCNRNYDFHWEQGSSCESRITYKGERPFSEYETQAIRDLLNKLAPNLLLFLSLHSYAQSIMYPWGYKKDLPANSSELQAVAEAGRNAIKAHSGRHYRTGSIAKIRKSKIGGSVVDYAFGVIKVPFALVMELPSAVYGFQPPRDMIYPLGYESWLGIHSMCQCALILHENKCRMISAQATEKKPGQQYVLKRELLRVSSVVIESKLDRGESI